MLLLNSWAYCFHNISALESNQTAELLPKSHPFPRGTALAYPAWQIAEPANSRSSFYEACISLLQCEFLENAGSAQPFIHPWYISYSSPAIPPIPFPCPSKVWEIHFPFLILPLPQLIPATFLLLFITCHPTAFYPNLQGLFLWVPALDNTWSCLGFLHFNSDLT